jgi:serine/threonine-protein kinase
MDDLRERLQAALGGAYLLERELGGGGMARVFVAEETALGRRVVVKVLASDVAQELSAERFAREVRLSARLQHPNVVPVLTAGVAGGAAGGLPFYTMPYVEGESLRVRLARLAPGERLPPSRSAAAAARSGAGACPRARPGVVHRDVKPENVLLSDDAAVVADFGVAKAVDAARAVDAQATGATLTRLGAAVGTPAYMAPEQAAGDPDVDHRADLYAWGVVAYELLAGRHPFAEHRTPHALVVAHLTEVPPPLGAVRPDLPLAVVDLVTRCLAKDPAGRPAVREVTDLLTTGEAAAGAEHRAPARATTPSIAVLPFANLSADPENEYFLGRHHGGNPERPRAGAGSARRRAELELRLQGQGRGPADGGAAPPGHDRARGERTPIGWPGPHHRAPRERGRRVAPLSERFDRELTDIFAVQDEIATAIADTLRQRLHDVAGGEPALTSSQARARGRRGGRDHPWPSRRTTRT